MLMEHCICRHCRNYKLIGQPPKESPSVIGYSPNIQACTSLSCMHCIPNRTTSKQTLDDHGDLYSTEKRECGANCCLGLLVACSEIHLRGTMTINLNLEIAVEGRELHWCTLQSTKYSQIVPRIGTEKEGNYANPRTGIHFHKLPDDDISQFE